MRLRPPTPHGRLYPRYDEEADLLEVGSRFEREWTFGIDIDGTIIFDIDANYVLANFDLLIPKRYWEVSTELTRPTKTRKWNLEVLARSIEHKSFHLPLIVNTNQARSAVQITFGSLEEGTKWAELSDDCFALVRQDILCGFFILLR